MYYVKNSCDADKYSRMAGQTEISCKKGAENRHRGETFWNETEVKGPVGRNQTLEMSERVEQLSLNTPGT